MEHNRILFTLIKEHKWKDFLNYLKNNEDIDVNIRDNNNNYLIHFAIIFNHIDTVSMLISRGSRLDIIDSDNRTILYTPIKYGYIKILNLLLHFNKINIGISLIDMVDKKGNIPLHYAINTKNIDVVKLLLKAGSDVNIVNNKGYNALHTAILTKSIKICKLILSTMIDINARINTGETALHLACTFQLEKVVALLIKKNIYLNIQDYDHELSALHYTVNFNNVKLTSMLLDAGADPNLQDYLGNTCLHYAIIDANYNMVGVFLNHPNIKNIINLNLYNIDSKLQIHLLLEKYIENNEIVEKYIPLLIAKSNINFKDMNGQAPIHYISKTNLWEKYMDILKTKKINIFVKNSDNKRPIDYIPSDKIDDYINMTIDSYIYILKHYSSLWKESWENICKKELFLDNMSKNELNIISKYINIKKEDPKHNICRSIIKKKLMDIYKSGKDICGYTSYPTKINKKCIIITEDKRVESCTFTGITLDILMGLLYLLKKHSIACSTLTTQFIENRELCKYYKSIGISTNTKCVFLNFEVVWVHQKLYMSTNLENSLKKCLKNKSKKFVIIPLGIELKIGSHANYLIYDIRSNEIERFEPYGAIGPYKFDYNSSLLDNILKYKFGKIIPNIKYISPSEYMQKIGLQYFDIMESRKKKIGDPGGFCALWSIWYTDMRLTYYHINRKSLVKKLINSIKVKNISFKNLIRNYSVNITKLRDDIFQKIDMTINDWINVEYEKDQLIELIKEITELIISVQNHA